jgi:hypothetical protein
VTDSPSPRTRLRLAGWTTGPTAVRLVLAVWLVTRLVGILLMTGAHSYPAVDGDVGLYAVWQHGLYVGLWPWKSISIEYPPGILPFLLLPGSAKVYELEFVGLALGADALVTRALWRRAPSGIGAWSWVAMPVLLGPAVWARFDIFVAAAVVGFVLAVERGRWRAAGSYLAAATLLKLWPAVLLFVVWPLVDRLGARRMLAWAAAGVAAFTLPVVAWGGGGGLLHALRYQGGRGLEGETLWALPDELVHGLGLASPAHVLQQGHGGLEAPASGAYAVLAAVALPIAALCLVVYCWRDRGSRLDVRSAVLLTTATVLIFSRVLSVQYLLWAAAAVALALDSSVARPGPARWRLLAATAALEVAGQALYPFGYSALYRASAPGLAVVTVHGICLALWGWVVARYALRERPEMRATSPGPPTASLAPSSQPEPRVSG